MIEGHVAHDVRNVLLDRVEAALELVQAMLAAVGLKQLGAGCVCPPVRRDASVYSDVQQQKWNGGPALGTQADTLPAGAYVRLR